MFGCFRVLGLPPGLPSALCVISMLHPPFFCRSVQGPEVIVAPAVLAERGLLQRKEWDLKPAALRGVGGSDDAANEEKTEGELVEEKEPNFEDDSFGIVGLLGQRKKRGANHARWKPLQKALSPEMMMSSMKVQQRGASSLLRFLVAVSMRRAPLAGMTGSEDDLREGPRPEAPGRADAVRQVAASGQLSNPEVDRRTGTDRLATATVLPIPPTRERSMYGTPLKQMQTHVDGLHQVNFEVRIQHPWRFSLTLLLKRCVLLYR